MNSKKKESILLSSALSLFAEKGYANTSISDIIDKADVARATFYLYFKNKEEVFQSLLENLFTDVARKEQELAGVNDLPSIVRDTAGRLLLIFEKHRDFLTIILLRSYELDLKSRNMVTFFFDQVSELLKANLYQQIQKGVLRPCDVDVISKVVLGSIKEMAIEWLSNPAFRQEAVLQGFLDHFLYGLAPIVASQEKAKANVFHQPQVQAFH